VVLCLDACDIAADVLGCSCHSRAYLSCDALARQISESVSKLFLPPSYYYFFFFFFFFEQKLQQLPEKRANATLRTQSSCPLSTTASSNY